MSKVGGYDPNQYSFNMPLNLSNANSSGGFNFGIATPTSVVDPKKFSFNLPMDLTGGNTTGSGLGYTVDNQIPLNTQVGEPGMFDWFKDKDNLAGTGAILGGIGGIGNLWTGMKQLDLQKDMFNFQKQFAQAEYSNQAKLTNERLATRYATRQAENPERFNLALGDYMKKYGAQEKVGG